jgi:hypothetical protein
MAAKSLALVPVEHITRAILVLRGHKVLLDSELAALYGVTTKRFNEQVRRNRERFPEDFMFQLTAEELDSLRSQTATSKAAPQGRGGRRYLPYAFTEHGARFAQLETRLDKKLTEHDRAIGAILSAIRELMQPKVPAPKRRPIGFTADLEEKP